MDFEILIKSRNVVTVGAFLGSSISRQGSLFKLAVENVKNYYNERNIDIKFECLNTNEVIEKGWEPHHLFKFLRQNDIHVIPTQGYHSDIGILNWRFDCYHNELEKLKDHIGYPMGRYISCPVFQQNKIEYLEKLKEHCIPTVQIAMPIVHNGSVGFQHPMLPRLEHFVKIYSSHFDNKFVGNYNYNLLLENIYESHIDI